MSDYLLYVVVALFLIICMVSYIIQQPKIRNKHNELSENTKMTIKIFEPRALGKDGLKKRYRIDFKKLLIVDVFMGLLLGISMFDSIISKEEQLLESVVFIVVFLALISVVAVVIDSRKYIDMWFKRDYLFVQAGYVHSIFQGNVILTYFDYKKDEFVTRQVRFNEDEIRKSRLANCKVPLVSIIVYVKGDKVKFMNVNY